ncbi:hypothetical protein A4X13_0g1277 [Tilletia indica]|uniref:Uncharacterized protein n=1 Tax=Tilletia indica TaxID=43049 RepID=A0A177TV19_9BASI|nr:hypothetical protein A4X13_0g1277 [Tilletia indica]
MSAHRGGCGSRSGSAGGGYGYSASGNGSRPGSSSREAEYMSPFAGGHSGGPAAAAAAAGGAGGPSAGASSTSSTTNGSLANPYASLQAAPSIGPVPAQQPPFPNPRRSGESVRPYGSGEPAAGGGGGGFAIGSTTARSGAGASTDSMPPPSRYWRKALQSQAAAMPPSSAPTSTSASGAGAGAGSSQPPASPQEANRASVFIKLNRLRQQVQELSRERGGIGTASASNPATSSSSNTDTVSVQSELSLIRMQSAKLVTGQQKMLAEDKAEKERVRAVVQTFEPLLRGPQIDVDTLRNFRLGRQKWLDMYAGRDSEGDGGGARRSIYDLLPEGEPIPEPPEHPNLDGIVFHGLRGSSFKAIGMSAMISEHSQVLQDLATERALREEAGNRPQAGDMGSGHREGGYGAGQANYYAGGGPAGPGPGSSHQQRQQPQQGYGNNAFGFGPPQQQQQPQPQPGVQDPRTMYGPYGPGSNLPPIPAPAYGPGYGYHPGGNGGGYR